MRSQVLSWPRLTKYLLVVVFDTVMGVLAMWMAFSLRLGQKQPLAGLCGLGLAGYARLPRPHCGAGAVKKNAFGRQVK